MKYLKEIFNKILVKTQKDYKTGEIHNVHDGHIFEDIIEILLNSIYPELKWNTTNITNDGNKDFWAFSEGEIIWAECKNYKSTIELKVIAPTLVMAQLCNANELYFFSVSSINDNAKKKICYYSHINSKKVHFIDDNILENLLLTTQSTRHYFEKITNIPLASQTILSDVEPVFYKFIIKNPFLNIIDDDVKFGKSIEEVEYNDIISEMVFVINNSIYQSFNVKLKIDTSNDDLFCFEYLEKDFLPSSIHQIEDNLILRPNEVITKCYNFRIISYREKLQLPEICIQFDNNQSKAKDTAGFRKVSCRCVGKTKLIGAEYETILNQINNAMLSKKRLNIFWCKGKSGVGKTRILEEATIVLLKNNYKILNFSGITEESSFTVIREIIYVLYDVTENIIEPLFFKDNRIDNTFPHNIYPAVRLLQELKATDIDMKQYIKKYGELLFEKLACGKYAIIIDNVQYYDKGMYSFLEELIMYAKNINRNNQSIALLLTINDDYIADNEPAKKIMHLLEKLKDSHFLKVISENILGMDEGSSLLYIKQLLNIREETYDDYLNDLVKKVSYNPYCIKYFADYMIQMHIASQTQKGLIIKDHSKFIKAIDSFPEKIKLSFEERWKMLILSQVNQHNKRATKELVQKKMLYILSCLHIFRNLTYQELVELGCLKSYIILLEAFHFIIRKRTNGEDKYIFEHDLVEQYFENAFPDGLYSAIGKLKNKDYSILCSSYPASCHFIRLSKSKIQLKEAKELVLYGINNELPFRLFLKYEQLSAKILIREWNHYDAPDEWIYMALKICIKVRERFGGDNALPFFEKFYNVLDKQDIAVNIQTNYFSDMLFAVCECHHHHMQYKMVINIYKKYLDAYEHLREKKPCEKISETIAFIYNRLSIAYAHFSDKESQSLRDKYIEKSLKASFLLRNRQYHAESLYDKANFYYYHYCDREKFINNCMRSCNEVDDYSIKLMTLHNIQRKIRLCFVKGNRKEIPEYIDEGFAYIEDGTYTEYRFFFSKFFHTARAMYLLLEDRDYGVAAKELHSSIKETHLFGSNNIAYNQFLLGKIYYRQDYYEKSLEEYKSAYLYIRNSHMIEKKFILEILSDDLLIKIKKYPEGSFSFFKEEEKKKLNKILGMSNEEYNTFQHMYCAKSIITSDDGRENYPSI